MFVKNHNLKAELKKQAPVNVKNKYGMSCIQYWLFN